MPVAASSSSVQTEAWLRQKAVPAAAAARAAQISPFGQNSPERPVGPIITGSASVLPKSSTERSRSAAPRSGCGTSCRWSKADLVAAQRPFVLRAAVGEVEDRLRQHALGPPPHLGDAVDAPLQGLGIHGSGQRSRR